MGLRNSDRCGIVIARTACRRSECTKYGMVLLVEPLAFKWADPQKKDKFTMDNNLAVTRPLVRLACELGADVIKCDLPEKLEDFSKLKHVVR